MESSSFRMDQKHKMTLTMKAICTLQNGWRHRWQYNPSFKATACNQLEKPKVCHYIPWPKFHWFYCAVKWIQRSINTHTHTHRLILAHLGSPVQMKGSDLCVVSLEVREIEEVRWGLLLPGLPAEEKPTEVRQRVLARPRWELEVPTPQRAGIKPIKLLQNYCTDGLFYTHKTKSSLFNTGSHTHIARVPAKPLCLVVTNREMWILEGCFLLNTHQFGMWLKCLNNATHWWRPPHCSAKFVTCYTRWNVSQIHEIYVTQPSGNEPSSDSVWIDR